MFKKLYIIGLTTLLAGCGSDPTGSTGTGKVQFSTWGEAFIEDGIPAKGTTADSEGFVDGWSVKYEKFLVVVSSVKVADGTGKVAATMSKSKLFNHVGKGIKPVVTFDLPALPFAEVSYQLGPIAADTELGAGTTEADKALMMAGKSTLHVEGTATKGAEKKTFSWDFSVVTILDKCRGEKDGKEIDGVLVTNGGTDEVQLTIHGDHLFYDDLQSDKAIVRFNRLAKADIDGDGKVTLAELAKVKLATLDPKDGNGGYGTGSAAGIDNLADFVTALSRTIGHYRGEGECFAKSK